MEPRKGIFQKSNFEKNDSFQRAIYPALLCAEIFGLFPVVGVKHFRPEKLNFSWKNIRTSLTIIYIAIGTLMLIFNLRQIIIIGMTAKNFVGLAFYSCCIASYISFLCLSRKWAAIMHVWVEKENVFLNYPYQVNRIPVVIHVRLIAFIFLSMALLEHALALGNSAYNIFAEASYCKYNIPDTSKYYFLQRFQFVFQVIPYNFPLGLLLTWMNFCLTLSWNLMDIFTIMISLGLTKRFEQINDRLNLIKGKAVPESYWQQIRLHYVQVCEIVEYVEGILSPMILISCTNDLYFICYQLLNIFDYLPHQINYVYFWYSLLYLILRTICLFLYTAEINDQANKPIEVLKTIPTFAWCVELDRFIHQTARESICLSGMRFFFFTRKLLLSMIGTVVTYELVLMQFDYKSGIREYSNSTTPTYACDFAY
ncbi:Gustatory receptor [Sergentomyia squamirostris]